jgi:hypothetical protein
VDKEKAFLLVNFWVDKKKLPKTSAVGLGPGKLSNREN